MTRLVIYLSIIFVISACTDQPEACLEVNTQVNLGEQLEIVNCSRDYESIDIEIANYLNTQLDLPKYLTKFDKPGRYDIKVMVENGNKSDEIIASIEVLEPKLEDLLGSWRLYKEEEVYENGLFAEQNIYDYEKSDVYALNERLRFTQDYIYFEYDQNAWSFFEADSSQWQFNEADFFNDFRTNLVIGAENFSIVGFHKGRMILFFEHGQSIFSDNSLLYFEKRSF